jgi:hypothetical protein
MFRELLTQVRVRRRVASLDRAAGALERDVRDSGHAAGPHHSRHPAQVLNLPIFALEDRCREMSISAENCDGPKKI